MSDGRSGTGINGEGQSSDAGTNGDRSSVDEPNGGESSGDGGGRGGEGEGGIDRIRGTLRRFAESSPAERLLISLAALVLSILVGAVLVFVSGAAATCPEPAYGVFVVTSCYDPVAVYVQLFAGAYGNLFADPFNFSVALTLQETTVLVFTGLSVAVAFRAGMFNIGSQGQLVVGALASALVAAALVSLVPAGIVGSVLLIPTSVVVGALAGGFYGAIPGALKAYADANEVITTIMLNFVATLTAFVLVSELFQAPGQAVQTAELPEYALFQPLLFDAGSDFSVLALGTGLVLVGAIYYLLEYTTAGYDFVTSGLQPDAAEYGGVDAERTIVTSMALSGALAGIGGAVWVLMISTRWQSGIPAYGFDGITVSILAGNNPLGVIPAALLFGTLKSGAIAVQFSAGVPKQLIDVLRGLIVLFVAMPEFFRLLGRRVRVPDRSASTATDGGKPIDSGTSNAGTTNTNAVSAETTDDGRPVGVDSADGDDDSSGRGDVTVVSDDVGIGDRDEGESEGDGDRGRGES
jgi:simple sugar transport system permease protein